MSPSRQFADRFAPITLLAAPLDYDYPSPPKRLADALKCDATHRVAKLDTFSKAIAYRNAKLMSYQHMLGAHLSEEFGLLRGADNGNHGEALLHGNGGEHLPECAGSRSVDENSTMLPARK